MKSNYVTVMFLLLAIVLAFGFCGAVEPTNQTKTKPDVTEPIPKIEEQNSGEQYSEEIIRKTEQIMDDVCSNELTKYQNERAKVLSELPSHVEFKNCVVNKANTDKDGSLINKYFAELERREIRG